MSTSIKEAVAEKLASNGNTVREAVVELLAEEETQKRVTAAVSAVKKLTDIQKEQKKINKADVETFNADGSVASSQYTKGRLDEIKKLNEQISKVEAALTEAFDNNNFQKLFDLK